MPQWRPPGGGMGTVDLGDFDTDQVVIHFGGALTSVDAYTFANSLVAFADTVRSVNAVINPRQNIEVRLEAIGPGSFRAVVKRVASGLGGFFSRGAEAVFWGVIGALIYEQIVKDDVESKIVVNTDEVVIHRGGDRIIIPRAVYDQMPNVRSNPEVMKNLNRTFQVIEQDAAIENFGLTPRLHDTEPLVQIPRSDFPQLSTSPAVVDGDARRRQRTETARLVILKAWLMPGNRKWSFEWNGVPISAPIKDEAFFEKLETREYLIGQGDALDVRLSYQQDFDESLGVYVNDPQTFEVSEVIAPIARARQPNFPAP